MEHGGLAQKGTVFVHMSQQRHILRGFHDGFFGMYNSFR